MKILIVVDSIAVNDSSGAKANVALIKNLKECGAMLKVYHYSRKPVKLKGIECIEIIEEKWTLMYIMSRLQRVFTRWTGISLKDFFENIFGFSFTFFNDTQSMLSTLKSEKDFLPDLVLSLSKGASFRPHYALLKLKVWHSKWLAYVHDPYPFHYYPRPYNWIESGYKQKEQFFKDISEKAKYIAFPSMLLKEWMGSYFPNFLTKGIIIPHQIGNIEDTTTIIPTYFNTEKFNILHAGNLMKERNPIFLMEAYNNFTGQYPEAKEHSNLLLIGPAGDHIESIKKAALQISGVIYKNENVAFSEVQFMQNNAAVNVILEAKSEISPFLPGKFPHCIMAEKPILLLGPYYSESKRLLGEAYPYWSEIDDVAKITEHIEILYTLWLQKKSPDLPVYTDLKAYLGTIYLKKELNKLLE